MSDFRGPEVADDMWAKWRWIYYASMVALVAAALAFGLLVHLLHARRVERDPRAIGTILEVWNFERTYGKGGHPPLSYGRLKFQRKQNEKTIDCDVTVLIGAPEDNFKAGDQIEVTPRLDSCYEPLLPRFY